MSDYPTEMDPLEWRKQTREELARLGFEPCEGWVIPMALFDQSMTPAAAAAHIMETGPCEHSSQPQQ